MDKNLKILMLEDIEEEAKLIEHELKKDGLPFITRCVESRDGFLKALDNFQPDVVLSDYSLPEFNSIEALKICSQRNLTVPFLLITRSISEEFAIACLKKGIDDYIFKGNLARLPIAIKKALIQRSTEQRNKEVEKSLRQQNKELLKTNAELDSFVYSVSHNLRGPMATMAGLLRVAELEKNPPEYQPGDYIRMMDKNLQALEKTISQILDYSRNARIKVRYEPVNLFQLIHEVLQEFSYLTNLGKIKVEIDINENLTANTDNYRLMVIFRNILSNAFQYSNKPHPQIKITAGESDEWTTIIIEDNGIGIDELIMDKIFRMFYRGTSKSNGAGLGLYIARESAQKIGARVYINSKEKIGTKVIISLPRRGR